MPFKKVGKNKYKSPSGRSFTGGQVKAYYAKGGRYPGNSGMKETLHNSPTGPGATARPGRSSGSYTCNPRSPVPVSSQYPQYFGPLKYAGKDE